MAKTISRLSLFLFASMCLFLTAHAQVRVTHQEAMKIGVKVWFNESAGSYIGLTTWARGEQFSSLGIGHFIWYPANWSGPYDETFPKLIKFMERNGVAVPAWLQGKNVPPCPWNTRAEFNQNLNSPRMVELREFLFETIPWQAQYMADRLTHALPKLLASVPGDQRPYLRHTFNRIASTPQGLYVLIDYVNFKGEGVSRDERYDPYGWGLLQVLEQMRDAPQNVSELQAFAWAADQVLTRRVENAPSWRHEYRWLDGWRKRVSTYAAA